MKKALVSLLILLAQNAYSDITRNCQASVDVFINDSNAYPRAELASVVGRGSCANAIKANECRERARSAINACLQDLWSNRNNNSIKMSCNSISSGSSRSGARLTWSGILPIPSQNKLTARTTYIVCCQLRPNAASVDVEIGGRITGDRKCASTKIGNDMYQDEFVMSHTELKCGQLRAEGLCN